MHDRPLRGCGTFITAWIVTLLVSGTPGLAKDGFELVPVRLVLNHVEKGDYDTLMTKDSDFYLSKDDMKILGISAPSSRSTIVNSRFFISLRSITGVICRFDEKTVTLYITMPPSYLPNQVIDFASRPMPDVLVPRGNRSAFLNYGVTNDTEDFQRNTAFNISNQLGINIEDYTFLTESSYSKSNYSERFVSLLSSLSRDSRSDMTRTTFGDFFASSGSLGGYMNMGGISYSRVFRINPYFVRDPAFNFTGHAPFATQADLYVDGMLVRSQKLQPGRFELNNLSYYGGYRNVEIVLKDAIGREERILVPFYFSNIMLRKGLHEFSYNLGFIRKDYGLENNHYSALGFSAYHRYGLNDRWTVGLRSEGTIDLMNAGPETSITLGSAGTVTLGGAYSLARDSSDGMAGLFTYGYQRGWFISRFLIQGFSHDYRTASDNGNALSFVSMPRFQVSGGASVSIGRIGSLSFDYTRTERWDALADSTAQTVTYSTNLGKSSALQLTLRHETGAINDLQFFVSLNLYPWRDHQVYAKASRNGDSDTQGVQLNKSVPQGEGYGYRVSLDRTKTDASDAAYTLNPFFQYNGRYGIYSADYRGNTSGSDRSGVGRLTASGALACIDGSMGATRPIYDSFALVKLDGLKNINVLSSNQPIGKTDENGCLFVPNLSSYYSNQIAVDAADMPMNYNVPNVVRYVSPWHRGGAVVDFAPARIQAVTGTLTVTDRGKRFPVEFQDIAARIDGVEKSISTGRDGEFYIENMAPGPHILSFLYDGRDCTCKLNVPASDEPITDLGGMICEAHQ